jgi:hypothetical protein
MTLWLIFQHMANFLSAFPELFLQSADEFIFLALSIFEVIVGQLSVLLLKLAFDFIPGALELQFVHTQSSLLAHVLVCRLETLNWV